MNINSKEFSYHFYELRNRLLYSVVVLLFGFVFSYIYSNDIFDILTYPLYSAFEVNGELDRRLIYTGLAEKFLTNIKLSFFSSFILVFPILVIQLWLFISPGLYNNEKKQFLLFIIFTPLLFIVGMSFVYFFILPSAWNFFISFEQIGKEGIFTINLETKVNEYLSLVMQLLFAFGLAFQLPLLLILLIKVGIIDYKFLKSKRRYAILISFVIAAILTPPDPLSQIGLAIPLIILYEASLLVAHFMNKNNTKG